MATTSRGLGVAEALASTVPLDPWETSGGGPSPPVRYEFLSEKNATGYIDRQGYEGYALQFVDETKGIVELEAIDKWGAELASTLYTYRSIARALPTVTGDDTNKKAMYAASFEVLDPVIERIKQLIAFKERAVAKWTTNLSLLIRAETRQRSAKGDAAPIPCEALFAQLLQTLDMLAVIDALKDTKACLNNDFSAYKRAFQHVLNDLPDIEKKTTENTLLQPCLANKEWILSSLRDAIQKLPGHDIVLADMATLAIEHLENEWYMLPAEKHRLLRSAAHALWLLDSNKKGGINAFQHKRIKRERFGRWFRQYPIVPLYGDMFAHLQMILSRCPNFGTISADEFFAVSRKELLQLSERYDVHLQLPPLRQEAADFCTGFTRLLKRVDGAGGGEGSTLARDAHTAISLEVVAMTSAGCRLMSRVASLLRELLAHKCSQPCTDETLDERSRGVECCDYERALRYNLTSEERSALVELLALLKSLHTTLHTLCGDKEVLLRRGLHEQTQRFIHVTMGGPTRKAIKYEKKALKAALMQLRNMSADWSEAGMPLMDEEHMKSKEFKFGDHNVDFPARSAPPSQTQLWLMRATSRALYDDRSPHTKGSLMQEADLGKETVREMRAFVSASACFPYLLRLSSCLDELADISCLWMREYYLELCKRVQFPISMSLPALLIEHVLAADNSHLMPMLMAPMAAYTDAANAALRLHRQQHLYTEIEAEANLVFDQLLYSLADQLFAHFKARAATALLPAESRHLRDDDHPNALGKCWYAPLLHLRAARLLGRTVDLSRLLTQRINSRLRSSLEVALERFESRSLDAVVDLHRAIQVTRLTHSYLAHHLPQVDPFESAHTEATNSIAFLSFSSRVLSHALAETLSDLLPNFAYRLDANIFQRPLPTPFTQQPPRVGAPRTAGPHLAYGSRHLNAQYAMMAARASGYFGASHAEALVAVLGEGGTQSLLSTINKHIEELTVYEINAYILEIQQALPEEVKTPSYQYGAHGCYLFYQAKLKDIAAYDELHSSLFHSFRRLGNAFHLMQLLEAAVHSHSTGALHQMPPRGVVQPTVTAATAVATAWGQTAEDSDTVLMAEQLATLSAPLASSSSLFVRSLIQATNVVVPLKEVWISGEAVDAELERKPMESSRSFHRIWASLSFLFATSPYEPDGQTDGHPPLDNATLFGDGVTFAGALLLHILSQRHRYELLDFSRHVLAVHAADATPSTEPTLTAFIESVGRNRRAHERFTSMLEARHAPTVYNVWRRNL